MVWDEWYPVAVADHLKKTENWDKKETARLKRNAKGKGKRGKDDEPIAKPAPLRMHADDADIFLKLSAALKILMARSIKISDLPRAQELLQGYLLGFLRVRSSFSIVYPSPKLSMCSQLHKDDIKPNFHWVTHIFDQILDYGPVYGFWTFVFERLNKVLKSYLTNNRGGGELEMTFCREFMRNANLRRLVGYLLIFFSFCTYFVLVALVFRSRSRQTFNRGGEHS